VSTDTDITGDVKKKRVLQNAEDIADLVRTLADRIYETTQDLGVASNDLMMLVDDHLPVAPDPMRERVVSLLYELLRSEAKPAPMARHIGKLFANAPKMADASGRTSTDQAPAAMCEVVLKCGQAMAGGVLSTTPEGLYRYGAVVPTEVPSQTSPTGKRTVALLTELVFELDQIAGVATKTEIAGAAPRIVTQ